MSGDEIQYEFQPRPENDEYIGNMDATVELLSGRYEARHEEEMRWRLRSVLENAYRAGARAVARSDIGWTPICDECGKEVEILGVTKYKCVITGCHEGKPHLGY